MRELLEKEQYEKLFDTALNALQGCETPHLTYYSKPVKFIDAPEDTLLVVVSPVLTNAGSWLDEGKTGLLRGSVITKLSETSAKELSYGDFYFMKQELGMCFSEVSFYTSSAESKNMLTTRKGYVSKYSKVESEGLVLPVTHLLWDDHSIIGSSHFEVTADMCGEYGTKEVIKPEEIRYDEFAVVVSDIEGRTYTRVYRATAKKVDAIRWTLEMDHLHYAIKEIVKVEIIEGTKDLN